MFIFHIDSGAGMRGGQWQALYLARGLIAAGHRVRLLSPRRSPLFETAAQHMEVQPLPQAGLWRLEKSIDLIHAHDARAHTLGVFANKPLVVSRRVAFPVQRGIASRWKYRRARHYIAISQHVRRVLIEAGIPSERITVVYDGVPVGPQPRWEGRTRVIALDSTDPGKGKTIVQQAAALAGVPVHFTCDLAADLPPAAVFVYITDLEGLGSATLLAMAAGTPVIASRVGGLPEIVEDGVTGLLTGNDPAAVAAAIQRMLADRPLAERLAKQARARVEREFSIDRMVSETLSVYERVLR